MSRLRLSVYAFAVSSVGIDTLWSHTLPGRKEGKERKIKVFHLSVYGSPSLSVSSGSVARFGIDG